MIIRIFQNHPFISCLGKTFVRWKLVFHFYWFIVSGGIRISLYIWKKKKKSWSLQCIAMIELIQGPDNFLFSAGWLHSLLEVVWGGFSHSSEELD